MIFDFRRTDNGKLEWRESAEDPTMCLLGQYKRVSYGFPINVIALVHFSTSMTWFVLDSIATHMLDYMSDHPDQFGSSSGVSKLVYYPHPIFIVVPWGGDPRILSLTGDGLAGSNLLNSSGRMCIGATASPFSITTIEHILANQANNDLSWRNDYLRGQWREADGDHPKHFLIETWPSNPSSTYQVPPTATAAAKLLSRS